MKEMSWSFCPKCGKVIAKGVSVCPNCGYSSEGKADGEAKNERMAKPGAQRGEIPKIRNGEGTGMTNIGEKIQTAANVFTFLGIVGGAATMIRGISNYSEYKEYYTWSFASDYGYLADAAINTIALGVAIILYSILLLFLLHGFGQLVINSDKLIKMAEEPVPGPGNRK